jgi:hypothetical protein
MTRFMAPATSPSHRGACPRAAFRADPWATGPSLSPLKALKGGEALSSPGLE